MTFVSEIMRPDNSDGSRLSSSQTNARLKLERVPDPARSPEPEEKLTVNKPNTLYYPGPNLGRARELFWQAAQGSIERRVYWASEKLEEFQGLVKLEPNFPTTRPKLGLKDRYTEELATRKFWARSSFTQDREKSSSRSASLSGPTLRPSPGLSFSFSFSNNCALLSITGDLELEKGARNRKKARANILKTEPKVKRPCAAHQEKFHFGEGLLCKNAL